MRRGSQKTNYLPSGQVQEEGMYTVFTSHVLCDMAALLAPTQVPVWTAHNDTPAPLCRALPKIMMSQLDRRHDTLQIGINNLPVRFL